jgi:cytochrome P450 monooxygenase
MTTPSTLSGLEPGQIPLMMRRPGESFPPAEYADFRKQNGLVQAYLPTGVKVWLVARYEEVRAVLTNPKISSNPAHPGFPKPSRTGGVPTAEQVPGWFVGLDPPEHMRFRKALIPEFTVRRVKEMREAVQEIVDGCVDRMLARGNTADIVADFALPVPSLVISSLLGVPTMDREFFEAKTRVLVTITATDAERDDASKQLLRYLNRLITLRTKRPSDDLISRMLASGTMSAKEISGVSMLLLMAGHETTANNLALGVLALVANPEWIGDERATEELLRFYSVGDVVALRVAVEDVEVAGQLIKAGEGIVPLVAAANHDPEIFECPADFDPGRSAQRHVAFGYGVHQCLGQNLVRIEMDVAYRTLFSKIPGLRIDEPPEGLPYKYGGVLHGLHALPVRW